MIKKVIFFIEWPLSLRDYNRFGVEVIKRNGFEVIFFDFTPFIYPSLKPTIPDPIVYEGYRRFNSEKEALLAISELTRDCFVINMPAYNYKTFRIYQTLSRVKIPYAVNVSNAIPFYPPGASKINHIFKKVTDNMTLTKLSRFIINFPFRLMFSKYFGVREPKFWLTGGSKSPDCYFSTYPFGKDTEILWLHTLDYNIYLENRDNERGNNQNKAVFLDAGGIRFSGDGCIQFLSEEKYFPSLCRFFDRIEQRTGTKVEIASHPRSDHEANPDYFGGRLTVRGKTIQMIKQSKFIITHASTAINFAALFKKPIIFITTDEYEASIIHAGYYVKTMASWLGKTPINIDRKFDLDCNKELSVDEASYANYIDSFIKKTGTEDLNSWQIFANRIKNLK